MNTDLSFPHPVLGNLKDFTINKFSINVRKRLFDGKFEFVTSFDIGTLQDDYEELDDDSKEEKQVIGNPNADNFEFYINPQIDQTYKKSLQEEEEGCLSIPEIRLIAERHDKIKVRYYDINGKKIQKTLKGFISKLFQHELDHLNGILMVENSKIKKIYRISENENIISLYSNLVNQLSKLK